MSEGALEEICYPNPSSPRFLQWQWRGADEAIPLQNASQVEPAEEDSLAFRQLLKDSEGRFGLNQTVITDPLRQSLVLQVQREALSGDLCLSVQSIEGSLHFRTRPVRERQALLLPQAEGSIAVLASTVPLGDPLQMTADGSWSILSALEQLAKPWGLLPEKDRGSGLPHLGAHGGQGC